MKEAVEVRSGVEIRQGMQMRSQKAFNEFEERRRPKIDPADSSEDDCYAPGRERIGQRRTETRRFGPRVRL